MNFYLYLFFFIALIAFFDLFIEFRYVRKHFYLCVVIVLVLFSGFRGYGVGTDDLNYIDIFNSSPSLSDWFSGKYVYNYSDSFIEPGYLFLNSSIKLLSSNSRWLIFIVALFSIGIASYNYYKYSEYSFLVLLMFFSHTFLYRDMNQIRSALAAALGLFLFTYIPKKQNLKSFITITACLSIHLASISYLIGYLFSKLKPGKWILIFLVIFGLIVGYLNLSSVLLGMIPSANVLALKLIDYSQNELFVNSVSLLDLTNIKNIMIMIIVFCCWDRMILLSPRFPIFATFMGLSTFWRLAFSDFGVLAGRVSTLLGISEVLLIPSFIILFRNRFLGFIVVFIYAFLMLYLNLFIKDDFHQYAFEFDIFQ